jgi:hypothetical protein
MWQLRRQQQYRVAHARGWPEEGAALGLICIGRVEMTEPTGDGWMSASASSPLKFPTLVPMFAVLDTIIISAKRERAERSFCMDDIIPWGSDHPRYLDTAEEFFGADPAADMVRWSAVQHWTVEEGVALSYGYDPRIVNTRALQAYDEHPFAEEFDRRSDLATRAITAGRLSTVTPPKRFIRWAKTVGINFPAALVEMVKSATTAHRVIDTTSSPSGLMRRVKTLSQIAIGMAEDIYGLNPEYGTIAADMQSAGISVDIESMGRCLKPVDDLDAILPEAQNTLSKIMLGVAIHHFGYDPKASRSKAPGKIAKAVQESGRSVTVDTILRRLKETASELDMA